MKTSAPQRALIKLSSFIDRTIGWDKLPKYPGLIVLAGIRDRLRAENLYDTGRDPNPPPTLLTKPDDPTRYERRTIDGTYNDRGDYLMGALGCRFGRNVPLENAYPAAQEDLLFPNVRTVSRRLLTRDTFQPASTLNLLAAAWIQFEVHDWFSHGKNMPDNPWIVPVADDDLPAERSPRGQRWPVHRRERRPGRVGPGEPGQEVRVPLIPRVDERVVEHAVLVRPDAGRDGRPPGAGVGPGAAAHVQPARREQAGSGQFGQAGGVALVDPVPAETVDADHERLLVDHGAP